MGRDSTVVIHLLKSSASDRMRKTIQVVIRVVGSEEYQRSIKSSSWYRDVELVKYVNRFDRLVERLSTREKKSYTHQQKQQQQQQRSAERHIK